MLRSLTTTVQGISSRVVNIEESTASNIPESINTLHEDVCNLQADIETTRYDVTKEAANSQRLLELQISIEGRKIMDHVEEVKTSIEDRLSVLESLPRSHRFDDSTALRIENESLKRENEKLESRNKILKEKVASNFTSEIRMTEEIRRIQEDVETATERNKTLHEGLVSAQSMAKMYEERCKNLQQMIDHRNEIDNQREAKRQEAARVGWIRRREAADSARAEGRMDEETWSKRRREDREPF